MQADVLPALGHVRLAELNRRQIVDLLHRKAEAAKQRGGNGTTANRLRGLLQRLLNKGIEWGYPMVTGLIGWAGSSTTPLHASPF